MTSTTMTSHTSAASIAQAIIAVAGTVALRVKKIALAAKHRRDLALLAGLDDRMLADIGLTRGDLRDAVAEPLWRDPNNVLVSRARERRLSGRLRSFEFGARLFAAPSIVPAVHVDCDVASTGAH